MTADRLRQAADRLAGEEEGYRPGEITICRAGLCAFADAGRLVELLRAIESNCPEADNEDARTQCWSCWEPRWAGHREGCIVAAALALADEILTVETSWT